MRFGRPLFLPEVPQGYSDHGSIEGSLIVLKEEGGGTFRLQFAGHNNEGVRPLDFENSIRMKGTWASADGARSYAVSLDAKAAYSGDSGRPRYIAVTNEDDTSFERRVQSLVSAAPGTVAITLGII